MLDSWSLEVTISKRMGYVITLHRSPSETSHEFQSFVSNLEKLLISWYYFVTLMLNQNHGQSMTQQHKKEGKILENVSSYL